MERRELLGRFWAVPRGILCSGGAFEPATGMVVESRADAGMDQPFTASADPEPGDAVNTARKWATAAAAALVPSCRKGAWCVWAKKTRLGVQRPEVNGRQPHRRASPKLAGDGFFRFATSAVFRWLASGRST